jgi:phospholipid/cholesterol/gamma-HCH transport system substrate-binding protein
MQRNAIEPILGALVLVAAVAFLVFAYHKAGQRSFDGYPLTARFSSIGGLETGGDVRIGGVKVGQVTSIAIDPHTYLAIVKLIVEPNIKLPVDSVASIATEGLLGGNYIGILPGDSDDMLKPGAVVTRTEAAVSLESLIGQFIYSGQSSGKSGGDAAGGSNAPGSNAPGAVPAPAGAGGPAATHP